MIAIKGMEMPSNCCECPMMNGDGDYCEAAGYVLFGTELGKRPDWCPLIEIPDSPRNPEDAYREDFGGGTP